MILTCEKGMYKFNWKEIFFGFGMHEIFFEAGKVDAILIFEEKGVCYSGSLQFKNPDLLLLCK